MVSKWVSQLLVNIDWVDFDFRSFPAGGPLLYSDFERGIGNAA